MKASELLEKTTDDLNKELIELLREQFNLRMQSGTEQVSRPHQIKNVRRNIARVKTVLQQKASKT